MYEILFHYNGKHYRHSQKANSEDEAKYLFLGLCYKKKMNTDQITIDSCTKKHSNLPPGFDKIFSFFG